MRSMFAAEAAEAAHTATAGWFLENAWLIPVIPAVAFFIIILFGKKLPLKGSEVGIASLFASFVLACGAAVQWISRVNDAEGAEHGAFHALFSAGRSVAVRASEAGGVHETRAYVEPVIHQWDWWRSGGMNFSIGTHIDGLSVTLLVVVTFIAMLIQIYSTAYVRGDRRYTHFFAALTLFAAGMLTMVSAESTILFLLGWEIMGLCSFMLIGHWWEEYPNARAALKAFFTVRTGDVGLLVGISILYFSSNAWIAEHFPGQNGFSIHGIMAWAQSGDGSHTVLLVASVALFIAAIGKSGQFPLHTWLPDAMAGPTPVSALLHSSTMVVAGVFLVARLYPVFYSGFSIANGGLNLMALIGGITIVISGLLALVQVDIKKVLAYSTVGQLGYMIMGLGVGAWTPAVFHIFTHAFFKACLFLGAGSVSHSASHHSFDMKKDMGGLWRKMPITFVTFGLSTLALCGVPMFAGFFSKDEIIDNAGHNGYVTFQIIGLLGAFLTTAYMSRCVYLTFFGKARGASAGIHDAHDLHDAHDVHEVEAAVAHGHSAMGADLEGAELEHEHAGHGDAHGGPHESEWQITVPLILLAIGAVFAGYLNAAAFHIEKFTEWVEPGLRAGISVFPTIDHAEFEWVKALPSILIVAAAFVVGFGLSRAVYEQHKFEGLTQRSKPARWIYDFLWNRYYLDHLYEKVIVAGIAGPIARLAYWINQHVLDAIVNSVGLGARGTGRWIYRNIDQKVIDGAVNGSGMVSEETGGLLRGVQTGRVQQYAALLFGAAAIGALILVISVNGS
jgi:NADH-quinone oxidoreductase subunit L